MRRELPTGDVDAIAFDEAERWLRVRRGRFELVCNFAHETVRLPCEGMHLRLATSAQTTLGGADGAPADLAPRLQLAPLSGARSWRQG